MIDLHAHILPGLDDGAKDLDDALNMCRIAAQDGITAIIATPHMSSGNPLRRPGVLSAIKALQEKVNSSVIPLRILPGAEIHLDPDLPERAAGGEIVTIADAGKYILVEFSRDVIPIGAEDVLFNLRILGLRPIITHPERNLAIQADPDLLVPLIYAGNATQITAASLTGEFGGDARRCAEIMVKRRMAHVVATDAHSTLYRRPILSEARKVIAELSGDDEADAAFITRPKAIIEGRELALPEPHVSKRPSFRRWIGRICSTQSAHRASPK